MKFHSHGSPQCDGVRDVQFDSYGHGLNRWREDPVAVLPSDWQALSLIAMVLQNSEGCSPMARQDLNNDGLPDPVQMGVRCFHTETWFVNPSLNT